MLPPDSPINDYISAYGDITAALDAAQLAGLYLPPEVAGQVANAGIGLYGQGGGAAGNASWFAPGPAQGVTGGSTIASNFLGTAVGGIFATVGVQILGSILSDAFGPDNDYSDVAGDALMKSGDPIGGAVRPVVFNGIKLMNAAGTLTDAQQASAREGFMKEASVLMDILNSNTIDTLKQDPNGQLAVSFLYSGLDSLVNGGVNMFVDQHDLKYALTAMGGDWTLSAGIAKLSGVIGNPPSKTNEMTGHPTNASLYNTQKTIYDNQLIAFSNAVDEWKAQVGITPIQGFWEPIFVKLADNSLDTYYTDKAFESRLETEGDWEIDDYNAGLLSRTEVERIWKERDNEPDF